MDVLSPKQRAECMSAIRGKDTAPELSVRRALYALGHRYRLHVPYLPGRPDIVFPAKKRIILVNGCFWHRHNCKAGRSMPSVRRTFWMEKLQNNVRRDRLTIQRLRRLGWRVLVVWQCQLLPKKIEGSMARMVTFLDKKPRLR
ncbi:MAG: very short patch repair endonuclease [Acidobacteriia bacterium]|nr:very short patch repair endonuclease [Terriglobia bacterium]